MRDQFPYVSCEHYDFLWDKQMVKQFRQLWKQGLSIAEIANRFKRAPQEVLFLAIDQYDLRRIKKRAGGVWGKGI
ncbi:hypothetical protein BEP19_14975 [Ammoniphilus oxalaticus]|uniref:Helix-turn-helix domain containing protein n=1 Tax=Ammoniphilus oxalaticus TaxID=66863 RepID=A0A419SD09_9BACL|nr:hypothetical protein [Ammoniphilus oxalaticus]RKD20984.1 hypothetical protein BEP19_14975 [Ammoniphilus oxalaticus]